MEIIDLNEDQVEDIESRLSSFDENYITYKMDGCIQIGVEDDGKLIAGLDACITAFKILYVSTVFVEEEYRGKVPLSLQLMEGTFYQCDLSLWV